MPPDSSPGPLGDVRAAETRPRRDFPVIGTQDVVYRCLLTAAGSGNQPAGHRLLNLTDYRRAPRGTLPASADQRPRPPPTAAAAEPDQPSGYGSGRGSTPPPRPACSGRPPPLPKWSQLEQLAGGTDPGAGVGHRSGGAPAQRPQITGTPPAARVTRHAHVAPT
ncbi:splicing factor, proline- and glutamine-rich-like [Amphibalanus amphitrite]|uniref:splicing factor, proline- and glutamine-rich-like n=1 Tax=Amphibalanus amphitrite TaxID=1232801 RepID=UPI001C91DD3C|nr:splicing factor, proline- and glutamine-rich-like [Amphibalanus amphitrite]